MTVARLAFVSLLCLLAIPATAQQRWKLQFFHDKVDSSLIIQDLVCPSVTRCIAAGAISEKNHLSPTAVVTADGGEHWNYVELKETPYSLFFHDASLGWMATDKGVWKTEDGGNKWDKLSKLEDIEQVYFVDAQHGWAAGRGAKLYETTDGGKHWTKVVVPGLVWPADEISYEWVEFTGPRTGFLVGVAYPFGQRRSLRPDWMDPERARHLRQPPSISFALATRDGGRTWTAGKPFSNYGTLTRVQLMPNGKALALLEFGDDAKFPTEVLEFDEASGRSEIVFHRKGRVVKDFLRLSDGSFWIASIQPPGASASLPIPGKLKMIHGNGAGAWDDTDADYRAVARNAILAAFDPNHVWVATDTGMILKLEP